MYTADPNERRLAEIQNGVADLGTGQDLVLSGQKGLAERSLDFAGLCLGSWLLNLPYNLVFSSCLLVVIWFYTWFHRTVWAQNFYADLFLKFLLALFYPIGFLYLIVCGLRDIHSFRELRVRPQAPRVAESVNVSFFCSHRYICYFSILHTLFFSFLRIFYVGFFPFGSLRLRWVTRLQCNMP